MKKDDALGGDSRNKSATSEDTQLQDIDTMASKENSKQRRKNFKKIDKHRRSTNRRSRRSGGATAEEALTSRTSSRNHAYGDAPDYRSSSSSSSEGDGDGICSAFYDDEYDTPGAIRVGDNNNNNDDFTAWEVEEGAGEELSHRLDDTEATSTTVTSEAHTSSSFGGGAVIVEATVAPDVNLLVHDAVQQALRQRDEEDAILRQSGNNDTATTHIQPQLVTAVKVNADDNENNDNHLCWRSQKLFFLTLAAATVLIAIVVGILYRRQPINTTGLPPPTSASTNVANLNIHDTKWIDILNTAISQEANDNQTIVGAKADLCESESLDIYTKIETKFWTRDDGAISVCFTPNHYAIELGIKVQSVKDLTFYKVIDQSTSNNDDDALVDCTTAAGTYDQYQHQTEQHQQQSGRALFLPPPEENYDNNNNNSSEAPPPFIHPPPVFGINEEIGCLNSIDEYGIGYCSSVSGLCVSNALLHTDFYNTTGLVTGTATVTMRQPAINNSSTVLPPTIEEFVTVNFVVRGDNDDDDDDNFISSSRGRSSPSNHIAAFTTIFLLLLIPPFW